MKHLDKVAEFHKAFSHPIEPKPILPDMKRQLLRVELIREELAELELAIQEENLVEVADALGDLEYVVLGSVLEFGLKSKFNEIFTEIHNSNMSKLENGFPMYANNGKIMKGKDYFRPDLADIIGV